MNIPTRFLIVLSALTSSSAEYSKITKTDLSTNQYDLSTIKHRLLKHHDFSTILYTALDDEITLQHLRSGRKLRGNRVESTTSVEEEAWESMMQHGWTRTTQFAHERSLRAENTTVTTDEDTYKHPFLLCSSYPNTSGYLRLHRISSALQTSSPLLRSQTVYNTEDRSCFMVVSIADDLMNAFESDLMANVTFAPVVDIQKFAAGTPSAILDDDWAIPSTASLRSGLNSFQDNATTIVERRGWTRSIMVDLISGATSDEEVVSAAQDILEYIKSLARADNSRLRSMNINSTASSSSVSSLREAFSLTSSSSNKRTFRTRQKTQTIWSNALSNGVEAEHGCQSMFDLLEVRSRGNFHGDEDSEDDDASSVTGFELILNAPTTGCTTDIVSSAWNKDCIFSLMIGLSVHSSVQTIEISHQIELASTTEGNSNPQWITQSGDRNRRPFFDNGLDGSGQVVAVADGGLDRDNCYFRDAGADDDTESMFGDNWDMTQRKIVHYDDSFGDKKEIPMGHGTYVSGIIAGRKSSNGVDEEVGYADGVAPGSKLSFFDMEVGSTGIQDPGVSRLFASSFNSGRGAKILNASWGRGYKGKYSAFCRDYDNALRSKYSNVLFVASSGNTGMGGVASTVQNPADCKNTFSVGASLSSGNDARSREMGIEYLADYSSRGPTFDGRFKPDIVAPGHFIVAANSDPSVVGECDGTTAPNVQTSLTAGLGVQYVSGTSMSSPVVAGTASILRQYFAEGWCDSERCCGSKGCGVAMNPSGSLLKALLMNGAQPLTGGIQQVPDGNVLTTQFLSEYDNNQGMGRLNLLNSVPLKGENDIQLITVNDKRIGNGDEDTYDIQIDTSNGCDADLRVTLAWYDAPGMVGCTNCLLNDIDVYMEEVGDDSKTYHPNGMNQRDTKNTVERIRASRLNLVTKFRKVCVCCHTNQLFFH
jgi:subtilisin family serine protease